MCPSPATAVGRTGDGYRHEAFFYDGDDAFMAGIVPFVRSSIEAGEPLLAVLAAPKLVALREALGGADDGVLYADMAAVGTNPARIIPAWQRFLDAHGSGGRVRGIGEPIWAQRSAAELVECQRHEGLLNAAFADPDFWLLCPYDVDALPDAVIDEARRTHPFVRDGRDAGASDRFAGVGELSLPCDRPLTPPPADAEQVVVDLGGLEGLRHVVSGHALAAGLSGSRAAELALAVNELATNSVRHGGGHGTLLIWRAPDALICEIRDQGRIDDPLIGRVEPSTTGEGGRGLWMVNQLCELVQVRSFPHGSTVRVHKRLSA
ncbi:MAG: regulator of sigma factor [Conexibacter sp.]|nr:regulator of sigma factor [Conexibacter sp.]